MRIGLVTDCAASTGIGAGPGQAVGPANPVAPGGRAPRGPGPSLAATGAGSRSDSGSKWLEYSINARPAAQQLGIYKSPRRPHGRVI